MLRDNGSSRQPRSIAFDKDKAYVCSFDGTVARIDTTSLEIEAIITAGRNPDDICVQNNKLYVSNSGSLDYSGPGVDNTVSVIDITTFKETKKIEVGPNPGKILPGLEDAVYVCLLYTSTFEAIRISTGSTWGGCGSGIVYQDKLLLNVKSQKIYKIDIKTLCGDLS